MYYHCVRATMRPGATIEAMIRLHNDLEMSKEHLQELVQGFNELNPHARPPRPGMEVEVPIMWQYVKKKENPPT